MVVEGLAVVVGGVLAAGVAVVHELDLVDPLGHRERHPERVEDEIGAHVRCELPADDLAAVSVDDEREEDEAFPAAQIGEVRDPELVAASGAEVTLHQVRPPPRLQVGDRRPPRLPAPFRALDPVSAHQPLDPATADLLAFPQQAPSTSAGSRRRSSWQRAARGSGQAAARPRAGEPSADHWRALVGGRRHAQGAADRLDPEARAVLDRRTRSLRTVRMTRPRKTRKQPSRSHSRGAARSSPAVSA